MRKALMLLSCILLLTGWLAWPLPILAYQGAAQIPTAPPPPRATNTTTRLPPPRTTDTPTIPSKAEWVTKTSTLTATSAYAETLMPTVTPTLSPTATMTPTFTPTFTPTACLNLHIVVYLDINQDSLFEFGEGIDDLLLLVNAERWAAQAILQDGEMWLALPADLTPGSDVQVQAPYLHWSDVLRAPRNNEIVQATLRLELPQFPVSLP